MKQTYENWLEDTCLFLNDTYYKLDDLDRKRLEVLENSIIEFVERYNETKQKDDYFAIIYELDRIDNLFTIFDRNSNFMKTRDLLTDIWYLIICINYF